jgi:hypothetical protein
VGGGGGGTAAITTAECFLSVTVGNTGRPVGGSGGELSVTYRLSICGVSVLSIPTLHTEDMGPHLGAIGWLCLGHWRPPRPQCSHS